MGRFDIRGIGIVCRRGWRRQGWPLEQRIDDDDDDDVGQRWF